MKKIIFFLFLIFVALNTKAQHEKEDNKLEVELELYPFDILDFHEKVVKVEAMFDYHIYLGNKSKKLFGVRYFNDVNVHIGNREMVGLLWYTEAYVGFSHWFQIGGEIGSIANQEYLSIGPEFVDYDNKYFKRVAFNTRVYPDRLLGFEYTTKELHVKKLTVSSTGTGRIIFPSDNHVLQTSIWLSHKKIKWIYFGGEYEYNSARTEKPHEFFFGLKFELKN